MSFKSKVTSGLRWNILDTIAVKGLGFLSLLILTRLLSPEDFGILSIVMVFITIGTAVVDGGMGLSLVRDKSCDSTDYSTVLITNVALGIILYIGVFFLAPIIARFYENEELTLLIRVLGLNFFIISLAVVQNNLLAKEMNFKRLTMAALPGTIMGSATGIWMALNGLGVWSLVVMQMITQLMKSIMLWQLSTWRFRVRFSKSKFKKHYVFGYRLVLSNVLTIIFTELYALLIGKHFSVTMLGYYNRARAFTLFPVNMIGIVISNVSYPMLSSIQEDATAITGYYQRILRSSFFLLSGIMVLLFVSAEPLFMTIFTPEWEPFIPYFKILCISAVLIPIHQINLNVFKVFNKTDLMLKLELIKKILIIMVFGVGYFWDIYAMLWAMVSASYIALIINSYYAGVIINYPTKQQLLHIMPTFVTAIFTAMVSGYLSGFAGSLSYFIQVLIIVSVTSVTYLLLNIAVQNKGLFELVELIKVLFSKITSTKKPS